MNHDRLEKLYRLSLLALPGNFRREYGAEMVLLFHDSYRDTLKLEGKQGVNKMIVLFLADVAQTAIKERIVALLDTPPRGRQPMTGLIRGFLIGALLGALSNLPFNQSFGQLLLDLIMGGVTGAIIGTIMAAMNIARVDSTTTTSRDYQLRILGTFFVGITGMLAGGSLGILTGSLLVTCLEGVITSAPADIMIALSCGLFALFTLLGVLSGAHLGACAGARVRVPMRQS
ncbi:MAG: hypothetical protein JXA42_11260 [Anaerolineales bacterium]|nr:hypothetical protein [Anaerolineales bacterium]